MREEILRLLKLRWYFGHEFGKSSIVDLDELLHVSCAQNRQVREECDILEAEGYIKGVHGMGGDTNPGYYITPWGIRFLRGVEV